MVLKLMAASTMTMRLNLKWKAIYHIGSIIESTCSVSLKADASRILKIIEHEVNENEIKSSQAMGIDATNILRQQEKFEELK